MMSAAAVRSTQSGGKGSQARQTLLPLLLAIYEDKTAGVHTRSTKDHAKAYQTLANINQQYDPECIVCHVVGLNFKTGFVSESSPTDLRDVGCEVCHGPASKHVASQLSGGKAVPPGQPQFRCIDCHTPEHSVGYAGHEAEYLQKIDHWTEP